LKIFQAIEIGYEILAMISALASGQATPPFKIGNQWFSLSEVEAPVVTDAVAAPAAAE